MLIKNKIQVKHIKFFRFSLHKEKFILSVMGYCVKKSPVGILACFVIKPCAGPASYIIGNHWFQFQIKTIRFRSYWFPYKFGIFLTSDQIGSCKTTFFCYDLKTIIFKIIFKICARIFFLIFTILLIG